MKKTILPSVTLLVFFLLTSIVINAQQFSTSKPAIAKSNPTSFKNNEVQAKNSNNLAESAKTPYLNYKGIADVDAAKTQWIKDHPAEYQKMQTNNKSSKVATDLDPNKNRRLPANYDDSKTNVNKK